MGTLTPSTLSLLPQLPWGRRPCQVSQFVLYKFSCSEFHPSRPSMLLFLPFKHLFSKRQLPLGVTVDVSGSLPSALPQPSVGHTEQACGGATLTELGQSHPLVNGEVLLWSRVSTRLILPAPDHLVPPNTFPFQDKV